MSTARIRDVFYGMEPGRYRGAPILGIYIDGDHVGGMFFDPQGYSREVTIEIEAHLCASQLAEILEHAEYLNRVGELRALPQDHVA